MSSVLTKNPELAPGVPLIPVIVPTRDEQGAVGRTIATLWNAFFALHYAPMYIHASCYGYAKVRTNSFLQAKKDLGGNVTRCRGFLLDDDILITDAKALAEAIKIADRNGWSIVAPYKTKAGRICVCKENGDMLTAEEFALLKPYSPMPMAGLGCYYGDLPLDYVFHSDGKPFTGEDLNFFYDNPELKPRVAPIPVKHIKQIAL